MLAFCLCFNDPCSLGNSLIKNRPRFIFFFSCLDFAFLMVHEFLSRFDRYKSLQRWLIITSIENCLCECLKQAFLRCVLLRYSHFCWRLLIWLSIRIFTGLSIQSIGILLLPCTVVSLARRYDYHLLISFIECKFWWSTFELILMMLLLLFDLLFLGLSPGWCQIR